MEDHFIEDITSSEKQINKDKDVKDENKNENENSEYNKLSVPLNSSSVQNDNNKTLLTLLEEEMDEEEKEKRKGKGKEKNEIEIENESESESESKNIKDRIYNNEPFLLNSSKSKSKSKSKSSYKGILTPTSIASPQAQPIVIQQTLTNSSINMYLSPSNSLQLESFNQEMDENNKKIFQRNSESSLHERFFTTRQSEIDQPNLKKQKTSESLLPKSSSTSATSSLSESPLSSYQNHHDSLNNTHLRQELNEKLLALKEKQSM